MSSGDITRYVVTVNLHEASLTELNELNELNNAFTRANFLLTLTDEEGNIHDLGTLAFGLISALSDEEVRALAESLVESVTDKPAEIDVDTWETWQKKEQ
ncbi:type V toxin-antitoxin system endoribonuclease antitoxin GhoS [Enterobacter cloacae]|uniref:type V toxin-antitoxin system endoribonuclease antitoxin GhoS n=1 Tax=Enterobacter cloacae TaxID=550 RepID=UPI004043219C